jgi:hypothetical protein
MPLRRLAMTAVCAAALLTTVPSADAVTTAPASPLLPIPFPEALLPLPALHGRPAVPPAAPRGPEDRLTVTVRSSGNRAVDGTYTLSCHPTAGTHWAGRKACARLDEETRWGNDPFAPVPPDSACTFVHGGPSTARITGTWAGRPVNARFDRHNGCEVARWNKLLPLLPETRS